MAVARGECDVAPTCAMAAVCARVSASQVARDADDLGLSMRWGEAARPDSTSMGTILRLRLGCARMLLTAQARPHGNFCRHYYSVLMGDESSGNEGDGCPARTEWVHAGIGCGTTAIPPATTPPRRARRAAPLQLSCEIDSGRAGEGGARICGAMQPKLCARTLPRRESSGASCARQAVYVSTVRGGPQVVRGRCSAVRGDAAHRARISSRHNHAPAHHTPLTTSRPAHVSVSIDGAAAVNPAGPQTTCRFAPPPASRASSLGLACPE
jgi:hypothetical protein